MEFNARLKVPTFSDLQIFKNRQAVKACTLHTAHSTSQGVIYKRRPQSGSLSYANIFRIRGRGSPKRRSALCGAKSFGFFEIYNVSTRTRREGVEPMRTFFEQGGRGNFFAIFVRMSFLDDP